jgi:hypothetical protein
MLLRRRVDVLESIIAQSGLLEAIAGRGFGGHTPVVDPPPDDFTRAAAARPLVGSVIGRVPWRVDPPPIDISRLNRAQLQAALHEIAAERARLESTEALIKDHLDQAGGGV